VLLRGEDEAWGGWGFPAAFIPRDKKNESKDIESCFTQFQTFYFDPLTAPFLKVQSSVDCNFLLTEKCKIQVEHA
jgi:hypothetical protein